MTDEDPYDNAPGEIDQIFAGIDDWRGDRLERIRELIHQARTDVVEAVKWRKPTNPAGVPVFVNGHLELTTGGHRTSP